MTEMGGGARRTGRRGGGRGPGGTATASPAAAAAEGRLREIVERLADGVVIVDRERGVVRFINPAGEALFGRPAAELLGATFGFPVVVGETSEIDIVRPRPRGAAAVAAAAAVGPISAELRVVETEWEGEPAYLVSLRDITDRKQAEERAQQLAREQAARAAAEAAEERSRFLSEVSALLNSTLDYESTLTSLASLAVPRLADWCVIDVVEGEALRRIAAAHCDREKEPLLESLRLRYQPDWDSAVPGVRAIQTARPVLYGEMTPALLKALARDAEHARLLRALGTRSVIAVPLIARSQMIGAMTLARAARPYNEADLTMAQDFAQRSALAVANARLYREAEQANRAKADFLAVMSHELRTPLNAILGYADLIDAEISGPVTPTQRDQIARIKASTRHLQGIIDEILTFSRTEAGREEVRAERVDLRDVARESAALVEPLALQKKLRFSLQLPPAPAEADTDPAKVRQILFNLLSNAVKFTERGSVRLEVREEGPAAYALRVTDTGIGIPPEHHAQIFEPFWQVSQADAPAVRRTVGGTGLGLTVARRLAELLGGSMRLESAAGGGSTFTVRLPKRSSETQ